MSGFSDSCPCPICEEEMSTYEDHKPFAMTSGECLNCGFYYSPKVAQASLEEVNDARAEHNKDMEYKEDDEDCLKPLKQKDLNKYKKAIKDLY